MSSKKSADVEPLTDEGLGVAAYHAWCAAVSSPPEWPSLVQNNRDVAAAWCIAARAAVEENKGCSDART